LAHFDQEQEFYLVQEFIEGDELKQELPVGKPLAEIQVIALLQPGTPRVLKWSL
jgi:hypothetical protein